MKFWNYIGEFLLLKWLFGSLRHKEESECREKSSSQSSFEDDDTEDYNITTHDSGNYNHYHPYDHYHDFHEEQDDYDMMDDF